MSVKRGRPTGHKPHNIGRMNKGRTNPCAAASPVIRAFFAALDADGRSHENVASLAGPSAVTLSRWRNGHCNPQIVDFENACQVLGYRIELARVPVVDRVDRHDGQQSTDGAL